MYFNASRVHSNALFFHSREYEKKEKIALRVQYLTKKHNHPYQEHIGYTMGKVKKNILRTSVSTLALMAFCCSLTLLALSTCCSIPVRTVSQPEHLQFTNTHHINKIMLQCQISLRTTDAAHITQVASPIWIVLAGQLRQSGQQQRNLWIRYSEFHVV